PSAKTLLSYYALTPALQSPTNAQDVGGSKGETSSRASLHGSKQGDTKMMLDGMSFNWFEGEGSGRTFFVNALTAQEIVVDTPTDGTNGRPFEPADASEDLRSHDVRLTWQINAKNKVNGFYEWQRNNQPNNFAYLNAGVSSMESGNPYCNHPHLFMSTWNNTA